MRYLYAEIDFTVHLCADVDSIMTLY